MIRSRTTIQKPAANTITITISIEVNFFLFNGKSIINIILYYIIHVYSVYKICR